MPKAVSPGPDGIPAIILSRCCESIAPIFTKIFSFSLQLVEFPSIWKSSWIVPIFEKGDKEQAANDGGITSLIAGAKVFEKVIQTSLLTVSYH